MKSLKIFIASFVMAFSFNSCEQVEKSIEPDIQHELVEVLHLGNSIHLQNLVEEVSNNIQSNGRSYSLLNEVSFEKAWKRHDPETGITRYSFSMQSSPDNYVFRSFVLSEKDNQINGHVFEYEVDKEWLEGYGIFPGWDKYNGYFRLLNLDGEVLTENEIVDGRSTSNTTTFGRSSDSYCITYTTQVCNYIPSMPELGAS
jgi:hypothetical protein